MWAAARGYCSSNSRTRHTLCECGEHSVTLSYPGCQIVGGACAKHAGCVEGTARRILTPAARQRDISRDNSPRSRYRSD